MRRDSRVSRREINVIEVALIITSQGQRVLRCSIDAPFSKYSALVTAIDLNVVDRDAKTEPPVYALYNLSGGA